jgi:hypothetical protein
LIAIKARLAERAQGEVKDGDMTPPPSSREAKMTQEVLLRRNAYVQGAVPTTAPEIGLKFKPGLRRFEIHPRIYGIMVGALGVFLATYATAFAGGKGMPLVLAICAVCFVAYFGLAMVMDAVAGDATKPESFAAFMRRGMETETGHMSGRAVLWQVVTLPLLIAGFGLFVLVYKAFL